MTDNDALVRKTFPVLGSRGAKVDWQFVADHGKQAQRNHYQTVERLAERGGLSWCELAAVIENREYKNMDTNDAIVAVRCAEAKYLAALRSTPQPKPLDPPAQDEVEVLREENARLRGALENAANAIDEMFRYFDGGETRGSYDGKPERAQLRKAGYAVRAALTGRQG